MIPRPALALLMSASFGAPLAAKTPLALDDMVPTGHYRSSVYDGINDLAAGTAFFSTSEGGVRGRYFFFESGRPVLGELRDCSRPQPELLQCRWVDRYGEGRFEARFDSLFQSFQGRWGEGEEDPVLEWSGDRVVCPDGLPERPLTQVPPTADGVEEICTLK